MANYPPPNIWIYFLNTVVFGLFVWFIQRAITNSSDRKIAEFKGLIDQQLLSYKSLYDQQLIEYRIQIDRQMEQHKSDLKFLNDKLIALHSKRLEIVKDVNDRLVRLNSAMGQLVNMRPVHPDEEEDRKNVEAMNKEALDTYVEYNNYILLNKIYFSEQLANKLEEIRIKSFSAQWDLNTSKRLMGMGLDEGTAHKESRDAVLKAAAEIRREIPMAIAEVEKEFREILGVA